MKVNLILPTLLKGGGVLVALHYANALVDAGHDVVCYVPKSGQHYGWKKIAFPKDVIKICINSNSRGKWFNNKFKFEFPLWINNRGVRDADITIATSWITSHWVYKLSQTKGKKVYFIQDFETWGSERINKAVIESYRLPFDECISVSTALHDRLLAEAQRESKVVCNGVEEIFLTELPKKDKSQEQIVVGMPYRSNRGDDIKNCDLGIRVLLKIKEQFPSVKLTSFGFKKPEGLDERIEFWGNPSREELLNFYNMCNIFYVPSKYEGWGLPAMEAMAQENAVVAGWSGAIQEFGVDGQNCIVLRDPTDEQEAVDKIVDLIQNNEKRRSIGINARKTVSTMTTQFGAKKFESILQGLYCTNVI